LLSVVPSVFPPPKFKFATDKDSNDLYALPFADKRFLMGQMREHDQIGEFARRNRPNLTFNTTSERSALGVSQ
jgi:hypothetical protein